MHFSKIIPQALFVAGLVSAAPWSSGSQKSSQPSPSDALPPVVPIDTRANDEALIAKLITAPTVAERFSLLDQPGDWLFDFNLANNPPNGSVTMGLGGHTVAATAKTFPALVGNGGAMTLGFLDACAINTPHVHNRATEFNVVVEGRLVTNFINENGVEPISNVITKFQASVFPQAAIHTEFNPDCEPAVFVAGFNNADPGVSQIAQNFFSLRNDITETTLGVQTLNGMDIDSFRDNLPANVASGIESCLQKCGLKKNTKRSLSELLMN